MKDLKTLRAEINALDQQLLRLLNARAEIAVEVGHVKAQINDPQFYNPAREKEVISQVLAYNHGPLANAQIANIFKAVMASCRALEQNMPVAYLGPKGHFCHEAVLKHFGLEVEPIPTHTIAAAMTLLEEGQVEFAVVPIENSTEGVVNETLDRLINSPLKIMSEVMLRVRYSLWGISKQVPVTKIYGSPQALAKCQTYLKTHYPQAQEIAVHQSSSAAQKIKEEGMGLLIGSDMIGEVYELERIAANIGDSLFSQIRFIILGKHDVKPSDKDKTSILVMNLPNEAGSLLKLIEPFARHGVDISLPSLRPSGDAAWQYIFYFDLRGHIQAENIQQALAELRQIAKVKVLGSYPAAWSDLL